MNNLGVNNFLEIFACSYISIEIKKRKIKYIWKVKYKKK
jgi:hypothetical protein